jgi:Flp pilus assembly protein TadG
MKREASRVPEKIRGAAAVEMTLMAPVLLLILLGVIEFGVVLYNQAMITNASREGARAGITFVSSGPGVGDDEIEAIVNNYLGDRLISFEASAAQTDVDREGTGPGSHLTVRVDYPFTFLVFPNFMNDMDNSLTLSARTVMRME